MSFPGLFVVVCVFCCALVLTVFDMQDVAFDVRCWAKSLIDPPLQNNTYCFPAVDPRRYNETLPGADVAQAVLKLWNLYVYMYVLGVIHIMGLGMAVSKHLRVFLVASIEILDVLREAVAVIQPA